MQLYRPHGDVYVAAVRTWRNTERHIDIIILEIKKTKQKTAHSKKKKGTSRLEYAQILSDSMHTHTYINNTHLNPTHKRRGARVHTITYLNPLYNLVHKCTEKNDRFAPVKPIRIPSKNTIKTPFFAF